MDTFTKQSPGMLQLVSAAIEAEGGVTYGTAGVITPLTTVAATLKKKHGYKIATATAMVARAFGIPNGTEIDEVDPISAIGLGGRNNGAGALMVGRCRLTL